MRKPSEHSAEHLAKHLDPIKPSSHQKTSVGVPSPAPLPKMQKPATVFKDAPKLPGC